MFLVRLIGGLLGIGIALGLSTLFKIDLMAMCVAISFILAIDNLVLKWIAYLYMRSVMNGLVPPEDKK